MGLIDDSKRSKSSIGLKVYKHALSKPELDKKTLAQFDINEQIKALLIEFEARRSKGEKVTPELAAILDQRNSIMGDHNRKRAAIPGELMEKRSTLPRPTKPSASWTPPGKPNKPTS